MNKGLSLLLVLFGGFVFWLAKKKRLDAVWAAALHGSMSSLPNHKQSAARKAAGGVEGGSH